MLGDIPLNADDRVLVDFRTGDDAGVYRWEGGPALVQTVDFFTPIVDDPYIYGEIAAANALSDVYAMGGRPLTALAIAAFPKEGLEHDTIRAIFEQPAVPLCQRAPNIPRPVCEIIDRALAKDPAQRWQSAGAMRNALLHSM